MITVETPAETIKRVPWGAHGRPEPTRRLQRWRDFRHLLGRSRDRSAWLKFFTAATSYRPFKWQVEAHLADSWEEDSRSNKMICAGIRTGKTFWSTAEAAMVHVANPGVDHLVIAPTYSQVREVVLPVWQRWMDELAGSGYPLLRRMNWSILRADLHCGGRVYFRSSDKYHHIRGFEFASIAFDETEYARNAMDALGVLIGRLSSPTANVRQLHATTTPRGFAGGVIEWWHTQREFARGLPDLEARMRALSTWYFKRAATRDNPHLPPDFFAGLLGYSLRRYLEEIEGYPQASSLRALPEYEPARHLIPFKYNPERAYDLMIDWGNQRPYFGWIQERADGPGNCLFFEWCQDMVPPARQLQVIREVCDRLGKAPARAGVDRADPEQIARLQRMFPSCEIRRMEGRDEQQRSYGLEALRTLLDPLIGDPLFFVASHLAEEASPRGMHQSLMSLQWDQRSDGLTLPWAKKDGTHDHAVDAATYWARAFGSGPRARVRPVPIRSWRDLDAVALFGGRRIH